LHSKTSRTFASVSLQSSQGEELTRQLADVVVIQPKHIGFPADRVREAFGLPPCRPGMRTGLLLPAAVVVD
jgi:hypothetical protein